MELERLARFAVAASAERLAATAEPSSGTASTAQPLGEAVLRAWEERAAVIHHLSCLAALTRRVRAAAMNRKMYGSATLSTQRPRPLHAAREVTELSADLGLNASTLRVQRANCAVLIAALRVATLRVCEAVHQWQVGTKPALLYRPRAAGGPSVRPAVFTHRGRNLLHALLFDEAQQVLPLPLSSDPLLLRWFGAGSLFRAGSLHGAAELRRMRRADEALRCEARFHGLATLAPRAAATAPPAHAELELLLYGRHHHLRAAMPAFVASEEAHWLASAAVRIQALARGKHARRAAAVAAAAAPARPGAPSALGPQPAAGAQVAAQAEAARQQEHE